MDAIIIAAGLGSRLRPLTEHTPKCLLDIGGKKILDTQIENLRAAGVENISIVTGYLGHKIEGHVNDEIKTLHNPFYAHCNQAGTLLSAAHHMRDKDVIILLADVLFDKELIKNLVDHPDDFVVAVEKRDEFDDQDDKVLFSGDRIIRVGKTRVKINEANGEFIGLTKVGKRSMSAFVQALEHVVRGDLDSYMYDAFQHMIDDNYKIAVSEVKSPWIEIDYPEDLEKARNEVFPKLRGTQDE